VSANLDLVRSIYVDWERGDFGRSDWADPDIEYQTIGGPSPGCWSGLAGMAEGARSTLDVWENVRLEMQECRELDGGRALTFHHLVGRARRSGFDLGQLQAGAHLFHVRDGKVSRLVLFYDRDRALADLGLKD
jgi:ketosteroid isomerase-like protein